MKKTIVIIALLMPAPAMAQVVLQSPNGDMVAPMGAAGVQPIIQGADGTYYAPQVQAPAYQPPQVDLTMPLAQPATLPDAPPYNPCPYPYSAGC